MNAERAIISRVTARPGDLPDVLKAGISQKHFHDPDLEETWVAIVDHYQRYSAGPDRDALVTQVGADFSYLKISSATPTQFYIDELKKAHRLYLAKCALHDGSECLKKKDADGYLKVQEAAIIQAEEEASSVARCDTADDQWYWEVFEEPEGLRGISTGFQLIDEATGGMREEQLIVLHGVKKAGKSSVMMRMAHTAQATGHKSLFYTFEMSQFEQHDRYLSMMTGVPLSHITNRKLTPEDREKITSSRQVYNQLPKIMWRHDRTNATIGAIYAEVETEKPDILFVDGAYLMDSGLDGVTSFDARGHTEISRGLKRLAQMTKIPVVASTQALSSKVSKRGGISSDSIGYSSAWAQDADLILGFESDGQGSSILRITDARSAKRCEVQLIFNWDEGRLEERDVRNDHGDFIGAD